RGGALARQLAVTADDYGASARVNAAILRAARAGVLTGASWMAGGHAATEALAAATEVPELAIGVHLTCVLGRAVLPPRFVRDLVDRTGCLTASPTRQGLRL